MPEAEAHRHEPPIPHDKVKVDSRKNNAEREDDKKQPVGGDKDNLGKDEDDGLGHAGKVENKKDEKVEEKPAEVVIKKEDGREDLSNEVVENQVKEAGKKKDVPLKEAEKLDPVKEPGNVAEAEKQPAVVQADKVGKAPEAAEKRKYLSLFLFNCSARCNTDIVIFGGSSAPLPDGEHRPGAEEAPAADTDEKMEGK